VTIEADEEVPMAELDMAMTVPDPILAFALSYQLAVTVALAQVTGGTFAAPQSLAA
jgi:hypothetical protein